MGNEKFDPPNIRLTRIYTKTGDEGTTLLVGGQRLRKDDPRIEAYGTVDELNACIGLAICSLHEMGELQGALAGLERQLVRVQHELFNLGSLLATLSDDLRPAQPRVTDDDVSRLEQAMDSANELLPALNSFVLPGGTRLAAELHVCRTVCRRAERRAVSLAAAEELPPVAIRYLNRLSDALFVWSRLANCGTATPERCWNPNFDSAGD